MIFLDLHKLYDALDRDICLEILAGCVLRPWYHRIIRNYWDSLTMVDCMGCCYGESFQGLRGITQGYPLFPNIFNVVVDEVVRNWFLMVLHRRYGWVGEGCASLCRLLLSVQRPGHIH